MARWRRPGRSTARTTVCMFSVILTGALLRAFTPGDAADGLERRLYVANDAGHRIDVFDVDRGHVLLHSMTPRHDGKDLLDSRCRGMAGHAETARLYFTDSDRPTDIRVHAVEYEFEDFAYRTPYQFGGRTSNGLLLNVTCLVRTGDGKESWASAR